MSSDLPADIVESMSVVDRIAKVQHEALDKLRRGLMKMDQVSATVSDSKVELFDTLKKESLIDLEPFKEAKLLVSQQKVGSKKLKRAILAILKEVGL